MNTIAYCGDIWSNNVGDEAILYANHKLFPDFELVPGRYTPESQVTLLGGGTILPHSIRPEWDMYDTIPRKHNYCLGVGVHDPEFWNASREKYDVRKWAGDHGFNLRKIYQLNKPLSYVANLLSDQLGDDFVLKGKYCSDKDYRRIDEFGFDRISVRGPLSQAVLRKYGICSEITGDPALYLEPSEYNRSKSGKIVVSLNQFDRYKYSTDITYVNELIQFLNEHISEKIIVLPLSHEDISISMYAAKRINGAELYTSHRYQINDVINILSSSDLVISERLHGSILSACCYTPFISLEYLPKNTDFARSLNMEEFNIRIDEITMDRLKTSYDRLMSDYDEICSTLEIEVDEKRELIENFSAMVSSEIRAEQT